MRQDRTQLLGVGAEFEFNINRIDGWFSLNPSENGVWDFPAVAGKYMAWSGKQMRPV